MKLYTRKGDDGSTGLIGGARVGKDDPRVTAYGDIDEVNAALGAVIAACNDNKTVERLRQIQSDLFVLGAQLASPAGTQPELSIGNAHITRLEHWIDEASEAVAPLASFVLPGGSETAADLHVARAVCRRAERAVVALARRESIDPQALAYLNRLSDLLFALAREANKKAGLPDVPWTTPDG